MNEAAFDWLAHARTLLFVPGDRPDRFAKAQASGADAVVLDLEDGVAAAAKEVARDNVGRWLGDGNRAVVRVNAPSTPWFEDDTVALPERPFAVMIPKVTTPDELRRVGQRLPSGCGLLPILETAAAVLDARALCTVPGVVRLVFGNADLAAELGVDHNDRDALSYARSAVVLASAAAGVAPPFDGVTTALDDEQVLEADTSYAAAMGFGGKVCIHPRQVPVVHRVLAPTADQLRWARQTLEAAADTDGAIAVDGQMVDAPILARARRLLARAQQL